MQKNDMQIITLKIPLSSESFREDLNLYKEIRLLLKEYGKPCEDIDFVISNIEKSIAKYDTNIRIELDDEKIIEQIEKHPYFKTPCDYPIRLITILKYLKSKGFNMNYADMDLYIDRLVQKMDGVKKVGRGLYTKTIS